MKIYFYSLQDSLGYSRANEKWLCIVFLFWHSNSWLWCLSQYQVQWIEIFRWGPVRQDNNASDLPCPVSKWHFCENLKWRGTWTQAATLMRRPRSSWGAVRGNRLWCSLGKRRGGWPVTAAIKIQRKAKRSVYNQEQIKVSLVSPLSAKKVCLIKHNAH